MLTLVIIILIVVSLILLGAAVGKPLGWIAIGFAVLVLLIELFSGWGPARHGMLHKDALRMADSR